MNNQSVIQEKAILDKAIEAIGNLPESSEFNFPVNVSVLSSTVHIHIPHNPQHFKEYRRAMGKGYEAPDTKNRWSTCDFKDFTSKSTRLYLKNNSEISILISMRKDK